jgi:hypothetical protein
VRVLARWQAFRRHDGHMTAVTIGGEQLRLFAGQRPDGGLGEIAVSWGRHGSSAAGLLDSYAAALSLGLGNGVPLAELLRPGLGLRFAPDGSTDDPEIPSAHSAVDYCCRRLAIDWLSYPERAGLGVFTPAEVRPAGGRRDHARGHEAPARRSGTDTPVTAAPEREPAEGAARYRSTSYTVSQCAGGSRGGVPG